MPSPRLSVVIPAYKLAGVLPRCVESVRAAGVPNVEVVVVDDDSPDDTAAVARSLGVVYLHQTNQRQSAARNAGAAIATGEYVAFLDNDDAWHPGVAPKLLALLDRRPEVVVAYADSSSGNPADGFISGQRAITKTRPEFWELPHADDGGVRVLDRPAFRALLLRRNLVFVGSAVIRRDAFLAAAGFDSRTDGAEDWSLCLRLTEQGGFAYLDEPLAVHYRHAANYSNDKERMIAAFCGVRRRYLETASATLTPAESATLRAGLRDESQYHADLAYGRGDYAAAAARYRGVLRESGWSKAVAYGLLVTALPRPVIDRLRGQRA